jgi:hypothetical protein
MWIKVEEGDGHSSHFEFTIGLNSLLPSAGGNGNEGNNNSSNNNSSSSSDKKRDVVTSVSHPNSSTTFIGTSKMQVYCIKHAHGGRVVQCHLLQPSQGLLKSIFSKLLGGNAGGGNEGEQGDDEADDDGNDDAMDEGNGNRSCISRNGRIVTAMNRRGSKLGCIAVLPMLGAGSRLLAVGRTLKMWSGYDQPGREQLEWTWDLYTSVFDALYNETGAGDSASLRVGLVHAELTPIQPGSSFASLIVLALTSVASEDTGSLYLLRVSVPLSSNLQPVLKQRQLVASNVNMEAALQQYTPSLHTSLLPPDVALAMSGGAGARSRQEGDFEGEIMVSWVGSNEPATTGGSRSAVRSLFCGLVDTAAISGNQDAAADKPVAVINCDISASQVLTVGAVDGEEGLVTLLGNGLLLRVMPGRSLSRQTPAATQMQTEVGRAVAPAAGSSDDVTRVMLTRCHNMARKCGETEGDPFSPLFNKTKVTGVSEETLAQLQHAFASMSPREAVDTVASVARKIINRMPAVAATPSGGGAHPRKGSRGSSQEEVDESDELSKLRVVMQEKVAAFYCMARILEEMGLLSLPDAMDHSGDSGFAFAPTAVTSIQQGMGEWEQQLLAAVGLSISMQEQSSRVSADVDRGSASSHSYSTHESFGDLSARASLRAINVGMAAASNGKSASPMETFFSELDTTDASLHRVVSQGLGNLSSSSRGIQAFAAAFGTMEMLVSAIRGASAGPGAESDACAFICTPGCRAAVQVVLEALLQSADSTALNAWSKSSGCDVLKKSLRAFCSYALESFALEAKCKYARGQASINENPRYGSLMPEEWKESYRVCKRSVGRLMLLLDAPSEAFRLAKTFLDFEGLLSATEQDISQLIPELVEVCREEGVSTGTERMGLLEFILVSYEDDTRQGGFVKKGRAMYLFELGRTHPAVLDSFLRTRPHLDWLYSLAPGAAKSLFRGTASSLAHLQGDDVAACSSVNEGIDNRLALASIAKLSALVSIGGSSSIQQQGQNQGATEYLQADAELACASLQKLMAELMNDPSLVEGRRNPSELIKSALEKATGLMAAKKGSGEAIIGTIYKILGVCLDLLRYSYPDNNSSESVNAWKQHVADVWVCSLQCQTALWNVLGKSVSGNGQLDDDDALTVRGTVFHQLVRVVVLPDEDRELEGLVDISPDLPVITSAMKLSRPVSSAISAALKLVP